MRVEFNMATQVLEANAEVTRTMAASRCSVSAGVCMEQIDQAKAWLKDVRYVWTGFERRVRRKIRQGAARWDFAAAASGRRV